MSEDLSEKQYELIRLNSEIDSTGISDLTEAIAEKMRLNLVHQLKQLPLKNFLNTEQADEIKDLYADIRGSIERILKRKPIAIDQSLFIGFILEGMPQEFIKEYADFLKGIRSEVNAIIGQLIKSEDSDYLFSYDFDQKSFGTDVYRVLNNFESAADTLNDIRNTGHYVDIFNQLNLEDDQKRSEYLSQGQKITEAVSRILVQDDGYLRFLDAIKDFKQVRFQYLINSNDPDLKQMHEQKKQHCIDTVNFLIINYLHILKSGISGQLLHDYLNHEDYTSIFQQKNIKGFLLSLNCLVLFLHSIERGLDLEEVLNCAVD